MALSYKSFVKCSHFHLIWIFQRAHKPTQVSTAPKKKTRNFSALVLRQRTELRVGHQLAKKKKLKCSAVIEMDMPSKKGGAAPTTTILLFWNYLLEVEQGQFLCV